VNPYAPPTAPVELPPPPGKTSAAPWTLNDVMSVAWKAFGANWPALVFAPIFVGLAYLVLLCSGLGAALMSSGLERMLEKPERMALEMARLMSGPLVTGVLLGYAVVQMFLDAFFHGGLVRMRIAAARGEAVHMADLFSGASTFGSMLGLRFIVGAPSLAASVLLVVAGVLDQPALRQVSTVLSNLYLLALVVATPFGLAFADYFIVDRGMGPFEAIRSAFAAPSSDRGSVFGAILVIGLIAFAGFFACCLGVVASVPYATVCVAVLYTRLTNTAAPGQPALDV
jgi:hypothetical protein